MVGILLAAVLAALTCAVCMALELPAAIGVAGAFVVLLASVPAFSGRFGIRDL